MYFFRFEFLISYVSRIVVGVVFTSINNNLLNGYEGMEDYTPSPRSRKLNFT